MIRDFPRALRMLERSLEGATYALIARENALSTGRVGQLVHYTARLLLAPKRLQGDIPPDHDWTSVIARRNHFAFWQRQIQKALTPTPGTPARSQGNDDATISDGPADHGEAVAPGVDQPRA